MSGLEEQVKTSPVRDQENNVIVFLDPVRVKAGEPRDPEMLFTAAVAADPDQKEFISDLPSVLPPLWNGKFIPHFQSIVGTPMEGSEWMASRELTHIVALESDQGEGEQYYFGGETLKNISALLLFSEAKQQYHFLHCRGCAIGVLEWIIGEQDKWEKTATIPAGRA